MKHLTINDINQLHAEQRAALNGMNRKYQEVQAFDKSTTRDFKPLTESGVEYPKARAEALPLAGQTATTGCTRRAMSQAKPTSSRAIAVLTLGCGLPVAERRRNRWHSRT